MPKAKANANANANANAQCPMLNAQCPKNSSFEHWAL
jgi:hypothetical protein